MIQNYFNTGSLLEASMERFESGGHIKFIPEANKYNTMWGRKGTRGAEQVHCVGGFDIRDDGRINDFYLFELDSFDKTFYAHIKLKDGEKLYRYESHGTKISKIFPLIKVNVKKGLIYFMESAEDEKNPTFYSKGIKPMYLSIHESEKM